jgi:hypothetical protein
LICACPADVYPEADIVFPSKSAGQAQIKEKFTLKQRC